MIDLHTHTTASDGSLSPSLLVKSAKKVGLSAIAITDHDTVAAFERLEEVEGLEVIRGIELTVFEERYRDIHVLGLFIDPSSQALIKKLKELKEARLEQKKATVKRLQELGYDIGWQEVEAEARGSVGRPHIAKVLVKKGYFESVNEVFDRLLAFGKPAYVERTSWLSLEEAAALIESAGGLSFLAHPYLYPYHIQELVAAFKEAGGRGVEVYYDYVRNRKLSEQESASACALARQLAERHNLLKSGGSDFHGESKGQVLGEFKVEERVLEEIKAAL